MKKLTIFFLILLFTVNSQASATIWINEFMQSNIDCLRDDLNDFPDSWVELYNDSEADVDIQGWYISNKEKYTKGWQIKESTIVPAMGYLIIYCDKAETGLHTSFRLESGKDGGIYLFDSEGTLIDHIKDIPKQPAPNIACGREEDGAANWLYFVKATPGAKNAGKTSDILLPAPIFSVQGGIYKSRRNVVLSLPADVPEGITLKNIKYTLDGSEPTEDSPSYTKAISITQPTSLRAKIIDSAYLSSRSVTQSYIITNRNFTLPVMSISLDPEFLWDEKFGIYVEGDDTYEKNNWDYDWRRPMNVEYFPSQAEGSVINQLEEMRISGGYSRKNAQKSLILYANKRFGEKRYNYPLFSSKPNQEIKSFILRNSGNDFNKSFFRDAALQLFIGGKVDLDYQEYQPVILFINGEYFGIENMRERSNEDFVVANYDGLEDIDMFENWDKELKAGDKEAYDKLMEKLRLPAEEIPFEEIVEMVDINEYINYMILEIFSGNNDFPENNVVLWRPKTDDGKWRFIVKDLDNGLGKSTLVDFDGIAHHLEKNNDPRRLFNNLIRYYEPFRKEFYSRFAIYMGDILHPEATSQVVDSIKQIIEPEMNYHLPRWSPHVLTISKWNQEVENMKKWCRERNDIVYEQLNSFFELKGLTPMQVTIPESLLSDKTLSINDIPLQKPSFEGKYFVGETVIVRWDSAEENPSPYLVWQVTATIDDKEVISNHVGNEAVYKIHPKCTNLSFNLLNDPTSTEDINNSSLKVITSGQQVIVSGLEAASMISLYDSSGRLLAEKQSEQPSVYIPLAYKGFVLVCIDNPKQHVTKKVIIK
ncbi:hypothetical protein M2480_001912 [Parabacteroides sp. PFB2-12]|uniref:CotH kinase family protein n=1 Tax=unclassified Parabacteroides TaxID=2649774 RepID=UPI0024754A46|nr:MULTISPECIES: CotH kinase family protein [unclassified Parabacteroides]MDH6343475.1 hypothetical protein [Parabacteroides sp. PM6-13]MDH6390925.1 hypothetical protein [Parabacteroides sp. PFB2-12]